MKLELDLYYVITNALTKFEVNISNDCREKSGKPKCDGQTDRQTDSEQTKSPPWQAGRGLIMLRCYNPCLIRKEFPGLTYIISSPPRPTNQIGRLHCDVYFDVKADLIWMGKKIF